MSDYNEHYYIYNGINEPAQLKDAQKAADKGARVKVHYHGAYTADGVRRQKCTKQCKVLSKSSEV